MVEGYFTITWMTYKKADEIDVMYSVNEPESILVESLLRGGLRVYILFTESTW